MVRPGRAIVRLVGTLVVILLLGGAGCAHFFHRLPPLPPDAIKPVVAVTEFENETGFAGQWKLGRGMADLLVTELLASGRAVVVERRHLDSVVAELKRHGANMFRKEDVAEKGRLKNARYLVRGVITDFTQTGSGSGWFRGTKAGAGMAGSRALVMITVTVTDVETGEILCSVPAEGEVDASTKWAQFDYSNVTFGGDTFFKTPIGEATQTAIHEAVYEIAMKLPYATWRPRVADVQGATVVLNGGENASVTVGDLFDVRQEGKPITDPTTGNVIGQAAGKVVGQLRVTRLYPTFAEATLVAGTAKRGDFLERGR